MIATFLAACNLPPEWEAVAGIELLTGCSLCERLVLYDGDIPLPGVTVLRVMSEDGEDITAVFVLCAKCSAETQKHAK